MKKFNIWVYLSSTLVIGFFMIISFISLFGRDGENLPGGFSKIFLPIYYVLSFPTHMLFWKFIWQGGWPRFFAGLGMNCLFYALLAERLISIFRKPGERAKGI